MSGYRYPKSMKFQKGKGKLYIDGHHTTQEIWDNLFEMGVSPSEDVREIYVTNVIRGLEHIEFGTFLQAEKIVFGEGVKTIPKRLFDGDYASRLNYDIFGKNEAFTNLKVVECGLVTAIEPCAFWRNPVKKVVVGDDCKIFPNAFLECSQLAKVTLGENCVIARYVFSGCPIEKLQIKSGSQINSSSFANMEELKELKIVENVLVNGPPLERHKQVKLVKVDAQGKVLTRIAKAGNHDFYSLFYTNKGGQFYKTSEATTNIEMEQQL